MNSTMSPPNYNYAESPTPSRCDGFYKSARKLLIVESNPKDCDPLLKLFGGVPDLDVVCATTAAQALDLLEENHFSVVLTELKLPGSSGIELVKKIQNSEFPATVIVISATGSVSEAVKALQMGAYDFLLKPYDPAQLQFLVQHALRERAMRDELKCLRNQLQSHFSFHNILSKNPRMHALFELIANVADSNSTVLIEGETGTGKEQVARAIHAASSRNLNPLVAVNCAALPETLLESELFGHEKGAFTNAVDRRQGRFEMAHGGTLLLDEIGDVPATMQAKLLRVLQERHFERVGGIETIPVDVRIIAATNRSLARLVSKKKFREDLYYRINVVRIDLPPLRERPEDIPLLATHFIEKFTPPGSPIKKVAPQTLEILTQYGWPGNIRQLENTIERACVTSFNQVIEPHHLPGDLLEPPASKSGYAINLDQPLPQLVREIVSNVEKQYIAKALQKTHGNVTRCARLCGLSRRSMTAKISEYKLNKSNFKDS